MPAKRAPEGSVAPRRTKSKRRTAQASTHEDADYGPTGSRRVYIKIDDSPQGLAQNTIPVPANASASASSSSSSIPNIATSLGRKAKPVNLKEDSTDEEPDRPPKRASKENRHDEGPARKKARDQAAPATPEVVRGCLAMVAKSYVKKDEQLRAAQDEVTELKTKLAEAQNHLASKANGRKIQRNAKSLEGDKTEIETLRDALTETKLQLSTANHKLSLAQLYQGPGRSTHLDDGFESHVESLEAELKKSQDELSELRDFTDELRADLTERIQKENQDPDYSKIKVSDDYIEQLWGEMAFGIQQLPHRFLKNDPSGRELPVAPHRPTGVKKLLEAITKGSNVTVTGYLIQRYVWLYIHHAVFHGSHNTWGGSVGTSFLRFTHTLIDNEFDIKDAEAFSFVKGRASSLLDQIFETYEEPVLDGLIDKVVADLAIFLAPSDENDFREELKEIFAKACELQRIFIMSRAFLIPRMIPTSTKLDEKMMTIRYYHDVSMDEELDLDIAVSPYLEKIGTADGWKFEQRRVLCRAIVTVKASSEDSKSLPEDSS